MVKDITRYQDILLMTCARVMFDLMDSTLYTMVMGPALRDLLGTQGSGRTAVVRVAYLLDLSSPGGRWEASIGVAADYLGRKTR